MFRVPVSAEDPTFDDTFKVGFLWYLKSNKEERAEWERRRNLAADKAKEGQDARVDEWADRKRTEEATRRANRS